MKLHENLRVPLSAERTAEMYADPAYAEHRRRSLGAESVDARVEGEPARAFTVTTDLVMPTAGIPDMVKRFVGDRVTVRETQVWQAPSSDGSRRGRTELVVLGAPASMQARLALEPDGDGASTVDIDGDLVAAVPLLGRKIEQSALPYVRQVLAAEEKAATSYAGQQTTDG